MSITSIIGGAAGNGIAEPIKAIGGVFDSLFTSDEERAHAEFVLEKLRQHPHMLQAEINKVEAKHSTVFVAGWRPFIGWTCGFALAWNFVVYEMLVWILAVFAPDVTPPPRLADLNPLMTLLLAMLGLGGMRTAEKFKGVAR